MNLPLNIDWQQILLHLFNFVILAVGLYFLLYKPVKNFMAKRVDYYRDMDERAKAKMAEAEEMQDDYQQKLHDVDNEIAEKKAKAVHDIETVCAQELQAARDEAAAMISAAQKNAEQERSKILAAAQEEVAALAMSATEKILLQHTASSAYDQFLDAAERRIEDE